MSVVPPKTIITLQIFIKIKNKYMITPLPTSQQHQITLKTEKQNFKQKIMYACTNAIYKLGVIGGFKRIPKFLKQRQDTKEIVILGEHFEEKSQALEKFKKIIWFTYRKNIQIVENVHSDVGWGCLPRVGQMVLAQALTNYLVFRGQQLNRDLQLKVIEPFIDSPYNQPRYSLSTILKYARWKYQITPGDWFNIGQICNVIRKIHEENPFPGTQNLKILYFNQSTLFIEDILDKAGIENCQLAENLLQNKLMQYKQNDQNCQQQKGLQNQLREMQNGLEDVKVKKIDSLSFIGHQMLTENTYTKNEKGQKYSNQKYNYLNEFQNHILIMVAVRIAERKISKEQFKSILSFLSLSSSLGIIGGVPSKGLYIVGNDKDQIVYLDPHYVQQYIEAEDEMNVKHSYFCQNYRTLNYQTLDPSMAFCFYIKDLDDLCELLHKINEQKHEAAKRGEDLFISYLERDEMVYKFKQKDSFEHSSLQFRDIMELSK